MLKNHPARFAAPLVALALAFSIGGCPGNNPSTAPTPTPKPPKGTATPADATPTPKATGTGTPGPSPTATSTQTTLPSGSTSPTTSPTSTATSSASSSPMATATPNAQGYVQVERLGRPGINEGLIRDNALLNTWNGVAPSVDGTSAAAPLLTEATGTLKALGNQDADVTRLVAQLLPDVMRIDTTKKSGYATSFGNANPLALDNVTATKNIPVGGRMITDDVMDVTLILIVPGGLPAAGAIAGLESDGVAYNDNHKPVLGDFPYLAAPN